MGCGASSWVDAAFKEQPPVQPTPSGAALVRRDSFIYDWEKLSAKLGTAPVLDYEAGKIEVGGDNGESTDHSAQSTGDEEHKSADTGLCVIVPEIRVTPVNFEAVQSAVRTAAFCE